MSLLKKEERILQGKQNQYIFTAPQGKSIVVSSKFQSGNIRLIRQTSTLSYVLECVSDVEGTRGKKSWYYFSVKCPMGYRVRLNILNVAILESCQENKSDYQPLMKIGEEGQWKAMSNAVLSDNDELSLFFDYRFTSEDAVYFALSIPFTYTDNCRYLSELSQKIPKQIYYKDQLLSLTTQKREVRLLTITQHSQKTIEQQTNHKPVVFITCRVHPGEVAASFMLMGILDILIQDSLMGYLLRRLFEWRIVPIVNPDGVAAGNYRMDPLGCNLNRHYSQPSPELHPAIHNISNLVQTLSHRIEFYIDIHSHSSMKQAFIYGNAMDDVIKQSYAQLFCRILEENSQWFRASLCQFGERHMRFKDRGQERSKQGCGRVMAWKVAKVVKSYTLESTMLPGYYSKTQNKQLQPISNAEFQYCHPTTSKILKDVPPNISQSKQHPLISANKQLGRSICISMLDMVFKNPCSRLLDSFIENSLKQIAPRLLQTEERFRIYDLQSYNKARNVCRLVEEEHMSRIEESWHRAGLTQQMTSIFWPSPFKRLKSMEVQNQTKQRLNKTVRLNSQITDFKNNKKVRIRSRMRTENEISIQNKTVKHNDKQLRTTNFLQKWRQGFDHPNVRNSVQLEDQTAKFRDLGIFSEKAPLSIDRSLNPTISLNKELRKNTPTNYMVQNLSPSLSLPNTHHPLSKEVEKQRRTKVANFYHAFVENRKRTEAYLKASNLHNPKNHRARSNIEQPKQTTQQKEKSKSVINRVDMSLAYRQGFQSIKLNKKVEVLFPWMRKTQMKPKNHLSCSTKL